MSRQLVQQKSVLHALVFGSRLVRLAVATLLLSFLLQPVSLAYAETDGGGGESNQVSATSESEESTSDTAQAPVSNDPEPASDQSAPVESSSEPEIINQAVPDEEVEIQTHEDDSESIEDVDDTVEIAPDVSAGVATTGVHSEDPDESDTSTFATTSQPVTATSTNSTPESVTTAKSSTTKNFFSATNTTAVASSTSTTTTVDTDTPPVQADTENNLDTHATTSPVSTSPTVSSEQTPVAVSPTKPSATLAPTETVLDTTIESTTTPVSATTTTTLPVQPSMHISDTNTYQFSKTECVNVGDGAYYCSQQSDPTAVATEDSVYAQTTDGKDKEIFIRIAGEISQLSDNSLEDDAPYFDARSQTVVWHRLIAGRYEIVSYDLDTEIETLLTSNAVNDMEPSRSGAYTVWQRWVDDNWEIMLYDGEEEIQISSNNYHDIAPSIRGEYVIWHTTNTKKSEVTVYEISTGLVSVIDDPEGGVVENPRFVLIYDTTFDNGDIITKGYDFESGEVVPLSAAPAELPEEIPSPDTTGETRALIQNKSSSKENGEDVAQPSDSPNVKSSTSTASSTDATKVASTTSTALTNEDDTTLDLQAEPETLQLTEFDLVIPPYQSSSSAHTVDSTSSTTQVE